jgi:hypothetical protein
MGKSAPRLHLGAGRLSAPRHVSVFVNCPYDAGFRPVFEAIVFSCICCGFLPRAALETASASIPRMTRIARAMMESKYSIHDLSRCRGEGDENFARFNMPLELGMAMAERIRFGDVDGSHDWVVLVPSGHCYQRFVSDLSGYDPMDYDGEAESVVPAVMAWLATRADAVRTPTPDAVLAALPAFGSALVTLDQAWRGRAPWSDMLLAAVQTAEDNGLVDSV